MFRGGELAGLPQALQALCLSVVHAGEGEEDFAAGGGERDVDHAAVAGVVGADDEAVVHGALDQADDGVVALLEELGELADGGGAASGKALDAEQELVLLGG